MYRIKNMDASSVIFTLGRGPKLWGAGMAVLGGIFAVLGLAAAVGGGASGAAGIAGMGLAFFFAGCIVNQARKEYPASFVFDNAAQHFIMKARMGSESRIGYSEIESLCERYLRRRGHVVFMRTKEGAVFDLWASGWTASKKGLELARRLNETIPFGDSAERSPEPVLPRWVSAAVRGDTRWYAWKDRGAVMRLLLALGLFTGLVLATAGFSRSDANAGWIWYAAAGAIAAAAAAVLLLSLQMLLRVTVLAVSPERVRRGRARTLDAALMSFRESKSMDRARVPGGPVRARRRAR